MATNRRLHTVRPPTAPDAPRGARPLPRVLSQPISCSIPDYVGVEVVYCLSHSFAAVNATKSWEAQAELVIDHFTGWPFDVAPPRTAAEFEPLGSILVLWLGRDGYNAARAIYVGNLPTP